MCVRLRTVVLGALMLVAGFGRVATAQERPAPVVEIILGDAGFVDEVWDHFFLIGGGARVFVTPRIAVGGEVAYLKGDFDAVDASNLTFTGNVTYDLVSSRDNRRVVPYVVVAGGMVRQRTIVGSGPNSPVLQPFVSSEGHVSGGIGARISLGPRFYIAPEFRLGWEPTTRITLTVGVKL
jgi:hypothetical protein